MSYANDAVVGGLGAASGVAAVTVLPNTGGEIVFQIAAAVAGGLLAWGLYYAHNQSVTSR
jgi:hypothetical protein